MKLRAILLMLFCLSCRTSSKTVYLLADTPDALKDAVARAEAGMGALGAQLLPRLVKALGEGNEVSALKVCQLEAQSLTAEVAAKQDMQLGRTSFRVRNTKNAPREWALPWVLRGENQLASKEPVRVVDLGDRVGVLKPIPTQSVCLKCHGGSETFSSELKAALKQAYPEDRAVGFKEGEIRGYFWAEVAR